MSKEENHGFTQAAAQMDSVNEMVAALEVDYERLEELRDERDSYENAELGNLASDEVKRIAWAQENPDDAEELAELEQAAGECESREDAEQRIQEDALSVEVRSDWVSNASEMEPAYFRIVLCTGGPHVEIEGELSQGEPSRAWLNYKDWGTSGEYHGENFSMDSLLKYASVFYFGE